VVSLDVECADVRRRETAATASPTAPEREQMSTSVDSYDVLVVGSGEAGKYLA
jgi:hypothetical protein